MARRDLNGTMACVQSHRTMSRVKSVSSPPLLLVFVGISMALAAPIIPLSETIFISASGFHVLSFNKVCMGVLPLKS